MRYHFKTWEQYTEAWMYLIGQGLGFEYSLDELYVDVNHDDDADAAWTKRRLKDIQEAK